MNKKGILIEVRPTEEQQQEYPKSKLTISVYTIYFYKEFNWFNRLMLRLLFGFKIERVSIYD